MQWKYNSLLHEWEKKIRLKNICRFKEKFKNINT